MLPQILIIAYNRPQSLKRLLDSVAHAHFPDNRIDLIISIDKGENQDVKNISELFEWKYGKKEIIVQEHRLGLKNHICTACDQAAAIGDFIVLEDDLSVSPFFYQFAISALEFYYNDSDIGGISLYSYSIAESCLLPFSSLEDEYDNYFMRFPSSWGQCFTSDKWEKFRNFYAADKKNDIYFPPYIADWKNDSWKKDFVAYLISQNKYFVFPKISLTTNFAEKGANFPFKMNIFRVPVQTHEKNYRFQTFPVSENKFDEYFELFPESLKKILPELSDFDFAVDIYGTKETSEIIEKIVLTTRKSKNVIMNFGRKLNSGMNSIVLSDKDDVSDKIIKPDFGARIFIDKNEAESSPPFSVLKLFAYRIKFNLLNTIHWIKKYFIQ